MLKNQILVDKNMNIREVGIVGAIWNLSAAALPLVNTFKTF